MGLLHPQRWSWTETKSDGTKVQREHDGWGLHANTISQSNAPGDSMYVSAYEGRHGTWYSAHTTRFSADLRNANGAYIAKWFLAAGWTLQSICGMLGNMQAESGCNPGVWEGYKYHDNNKSAWGLGLTQWTRYFKLTDWVHDQGNDDLVYNIDTQCARIDYEKNNNIQYGKNGRWNKYNFQQFSQSTADPGYLGECFAACYERSSAILGYEGQEAQEKAIKARRNNSLAWWDRLDGGNYTPAPPDVPGEPEPIIPPEPPYIEPEPEIRKHLWMLFKLARKI